MKFPLITTLAALAVSGAALAQQQGVSKTEITVGTIQDLSGPLAGYGKAVRNGMLLRIDEVNEQGGVNGRKLKLITEDSGYDPKRAVLAAQNWSTKTKFSSWPRTWAPPKTMPPCPCSLKRKS
jgi:branched-chain amino acid transport system substrate-binding protein